MCGGEGLSEEQIAAARAAAAPDSPEDGVDWGKGVVTPGGGVAATLIELRNARNTLRPLSTPRWRGGE